MELSNQFEVDVPIDEAWAILTDLERIAPCMPGAQLTEVEGEEYRGTVKVKVGPITAQYRGIATFEERDATEHRAVLRAEGRDTRGQGNANATVVAVLAPAGEREGATTVSIQTQLTVTGKVAQFGRGVMADVSAKLIGQFVSCLHERVLSGELTPPAAAGEPEHNGSAGTDADAKPEVRRVEAPEAEPVDLLDTAGGAVAKRVLPVLVALGLAGVLVWVLRARRR